MGSAKICVSVAAETAEAFLSQARQAAVHSGAIELRFDALDPSQIPQVWEGLREIRSGYKGTVIATFRSSDNGQGGFRSIPRSEREDFWRGSDVRMIADWVDVEEDIDGSCLLTGDEPAFRRTIRSFHSFSGHPDIAELRARRASLLSSSKEELRPVAKIACRSEDITDALEVWKLLDDSNADRRDTIAISMGDPGAWTRILGPAFGSLMTYAKLPDGEPAAPGQISLDELRDLYQVEHLDRSTSIYGIVGFPARHSISPRIHNPAFAHSGLNSVYVPFPTQNLDAFFRKMVSPRTREIAWNLEGLSITHPHKQRVIPFLDEVDRNAASIGAVNTVRIEGGRMRGFNTDCDGFVKALRAVFGDVKGASAGIIGTGGAARAAAQGLANEGAVVSIFSRDPARGPLVLEDRSFSSKPLTTAEDCFGGTDILINATPQGSKGALENETPATSGQMRNLQLAFDMVYNPKVTCFLREAAEAGIPCTGGIEMLIEQAILQFEIWTGRPAPADVMRAAVADLF